MKWLNEGSGRGEEGDEGGGEAARIPAPRRILALGQCGYEKGVAVGVVFLVVLLTGLRWG